MLDLTLITLTVDNETLLKEYYKQTKPYLEGDDIESYARRFFIR